MVAKGEKSELEHSFAKRPMKGPGRPRTPAVFMEWSDAAAALVVACATGKIVDEFKDLPTIKEFAENSPLALRKEAAIHILDRRYGKPREHVESEGLDSLSVLARALLEPAGAHDGDGDVVDVPPQLTDNDT